MGVAPLHRGPGPPGLTRVGGFGVARYLLEGVPDGRTGRTVRIGVRIGLGRGRGAGGRDAAGASAAPGA